MKQNSSYNPQILQIGNKWTSYCLQFKTKRNINTSCQKQSKQLKILQTKHHTSIWKCISEEQNPCPSQETISFSRNQKIIIFQHLHPICFKRKHKKVGFRHRNANLCRLQITHAGTCITKLCIFFSGKWTPWRPKMFIFGWLSDSSGRPLPRNSTPNICHTTRAEGVSGGDPTLFATIQSPWGILAASVWPQHE